MDTDPIKAAENAPLPDEPTPVEPAKPETTPADTGAAPDGDDPAATDDADTDQDEGDKVAASLARKLRREQREINRLTARRREAEQERDHWREMALRNAPQQPQVTPQQPPAQLQPPQQKDFPTYEEYIDARAAFVARQSLAQADEARRRASYQSQQEEFQADLVHRRNQALEAARAKYADYHDVIDASDAPITPAMDMAMVESGMAGDVAYFLGKNSQEAHRIAQLKPAAQMLAIGQIVARISQKPPKPASNAPNPVPTVTGGSNATRDVSKMSYREYVEYRKKGGGS